PTARRQEHLAPRAHAGGARPRQERDLGPADGRRCEDQRACAAPARCGDLQDLGVGSQDFELPTPDSKLPPQMRQLQHPRPVASAQVKRGLLFAGLTGQVPVTIREPYRSRDHTERLLAHLGLGVHERDGAIVYQPGSASTIPGFQLSVPGDISSAAFLMAAVVLADQGELVVENVGVNPTRTGFLVVLERMGAHIERVNLRDEGGEPVADLVMRPATLPGTEVAGAELPTLG